MGKKYDEAWELEERELGDVDKKWDSEGEHDVDRNGKYGSE
jgi:hypothetical protein